jgi:hypothetical protein
VRRGAKPRNDHTRVAVTHPPDNARSRKRDSGVTCSLPAQSDAYREMLGWCDSAGQMIKDETILASEQTDEGDLAQRVTRRVSLGVELEESTARQHRAEVTDPAEGRTLRSCRTGDMANQFHTPLALDVK